MVVVGVKTNFRTLEGIALVEMLHVGCGCGADEASGDDVCGLGGGGEGEIYVVAVCGLQLPVSVRCWGETS